jgi:hypothetical protein
VFAPNGIGGAHKQLSAADVDVLSILQSFPQRLSCFLPPVRLGVVVYVREVCRRCRGAGAAVKRALRGPGRALAKDASPRSKQQSQLKHSPPH